uniref:Uncharacterized protein n=1 Tax=Kalanchoe fedtschenkoi TaxID=63787 RepID=A0A7N1A4P5_KALFE
MPPYLHLQHMLRFYWPVKSGLFVRPGQLLFVEGPPDAAALAPIPPARPSRRLEVRSALSRPIPRQFPPQLAIEGSCVTDSHWPARRRVVRRPPKALAPNTAASVASPSNGWVSGWLGLCKISDLGSSQRRASDSALTGRPL